MEARAGGEGRGYEGHMEASIGELIGRTTVERELTRRATEEESDARRGKRAAAEITVTTLSERLPLIGREGPGRMDLYGHYRS